MRCNENRQKSDAGTLFCCFTLLVASDRNIIFNIIPMVSLELYNECISILYILLLILESPYMKKDTKSDMYATFLFFPL